MKILYYAKHGPHDNCDEDAIAHGLRVLGHEVTCVEETTGTSDPALRRLSKGHDFCLFHKVEAPADVVCPRVFWYFDLMEYDERETASETDDPLAQRVANTWFHRGVQRRAWATAVEPHCLVAFYTDGDWVAKDPAKRVHLCQGADERTAGYGTPLKESWPPILFTGMTNHGVRRMRFLSALEARYGGRFQVFGHIPRYRKHGRDLADLFASVKVVVAPDGPSTDRYWSNRIFLTTGLGGFMLHPYCAKLTEQYHNWRHWIYRSQDHLYQMIDHYLKTDTRTFLCRIQHQETMDRHTYRHRAEELVRVVKERL